MRHPRYAALNDIIKRSLQSAGVPSILELVGVDWRYGKRPEDIITVFSFSNGRCLTWNVAYINIHSSVISAGHAALKSKERKCRNHEALGARFRFKLPAIETARVYEESTAALISEVGICITYLTRESWETVWLEQRLGLAVQCAQHFD